MAGGLLNIVFTGNNNIFLTHKQDFSTSNLISLAWTNRFLCLKVPLDNTFEKVYNSTIVTEINVTTNGKFCKAKMNLYVFHCKEAN